MYVLILLKTLKRHIPLLIDSNCIFYVIFANKKETNQWQNKQ